MAVTVFPDEIYAAPRRAGRSGRIRRLIYFNKLAKGGALRGVGAAAILFTKEMRVSFRQLRK